MPMSIPTTTLKQNKHVLANYALYESQPSRQ
jgi:hypothetical protein